MLVCVLTCMCAAQVLGAMLLLRRVLEKLNWHWSQADHDFDRKGF